MLQKVRFNFSCSPYTAQKRNCAHTSPIFKGLNQDTFTLNHPNNTLRSTYEKGAWVFTRDNHKPVKFQITEDEAYHYYYSSIGNKKIADCIIYDDYTALKDILNIYIDRCQDTKEREFLKKHLKDGYLYLATLDTVKDYNGESEYIGAGAQMLELARIISIEKGKGGRIILLASNHKKSPVPFYYKMGFRFLNKDLNGLVEKYLNEGRELDERAIRGYMYLPEDKLNTPIAETYFKRKGFKIEN